MSATAARRRRIWTLPLMSALCIMLAIGAAGCASGGAETKPTATTAAVTTPLAGAAGFVQSDGTHLLYRGRSIKLYGYTFYPATAGGAAAWRSSSFTGYIDHTLDMGLAAGQNLARPTDYWNRTDSGQTWDDPTIWANMDYLVQAAQRRGMYVLMDLSAYKWLLISEGKDPYDAANWTQLLDFVGQRYRTATAIAAYTIVGEPPAPKTSDGTQQLVAFYRAVTDELFAADGGHHLIAAGGFNHMEDETAATRWWQQIYALPHNDLVAFKTYSRHDLDLMSAIAAVARGLQKPMVEEEFGMPQYMGDGAYAGGAGGLNGIAMDRADFFATVYTSGERLGVGAFVFWNLGCQQGAQSYEVGPLTPAVWRTVTEHAAVTPVPWTGAAPMC